jgi:hypothetical protein
MGNRVQETNKNLNRLLSNSWFKRQFKPHCKLVINHGTGWWNSHKHKRVKNDKIGSAIMMIANPIYRKTPMTDNAVKFNI